jgi:hypothetical protein
MSQESFTPQYLAADGTNVHVAISSQCEAGKGILYYHSTNAGAAFQPRRLLNSLNFDEWAGPAWVTAGNGKVTIEITDDVDHIHIDVSDTGKGIPKSRFKTIFRPGFTSKARGWGLGLTLTKRIVENYHSGKIFVKSSTLNKGTTFRIILKK